MDYTWKQNRLSKDKEALKNSMLTVIRKKPKMQQNTGQVSDTFIYKFACYVQQQVTGAADQGVGASPNKNAGGAQGLVVD